LFRSVKSCKNQADPALDLAGNHKVMDITIPLKDMTAVV
jgi:hypothetical protein